MRNYCLRALKGALEVVLSHMYNPFFSYYKCLNGLKHRDFHSFNLAAFVKVTVIRGKKDDDTHIKCVEQETRYVLHYNAYLVVILENVEQYRTGKQRDSHMGGYMVPLTTFVKSLVTPCRTNHISEIAGARYTEQLTELWSFRSSYVQ